MAAARQYAEHKRTHDDLRNYNIGYEPLVWENTDGAEEKRLLRSLARMVDKKHALYLRITWTQFKTRILFKLKRNYYLACERHREAAFGRAYRLMNWFPWFCLLL